MLKRFRSYHRWFFFLSTVLTISLSRTELLSNLYVQIILTAISVSIFGIPHGTFDFELIKTNKLISNFFKSSNSFGLSYLVLAALLALIWLGVPYFALAFFLLVSVYHWGESDAVAPQDSSLVELIRYLIEFSFYGTALISLTSIFHRETLINLFAILSNLDAAVNLVSILNNLSYLIIFFSFLLLNYYSFKGQINKAMEILLVTLAMLYCEPLIGFIIYFCFLHSPKHILDFFEKGDVPERFFTKLLIGTIVSIVFMFLIFLFINSLSIENINLQIFKVVFISLAGLTIPHVLFVRLWHLRTH
ncbi:MAG: Brp/Blh family beta-carotene 15,15'-dioxygenase [Candidatus Caenarcaniphilales bacterium]|nr:Brp/Blh family beta-carotene 15,15'-dioxygenase [Candidatus Caenarcaniphilales bacterium]